MADAKCDLFSMRITRTWTKDHDGLSSFLNRMNKVGKGETESGGQKWTTEEWRFPHAYRGGRLLTCGCFVALFFWPQAERELEPRLGNISAQVESIISDHHCQSCYGHASPE
jgi:hypothetical protein